MSARTIQTSIDIDAGADVVWRVLMDFSAYPRWNPFIYQLEGQPLKGERLSVLIQPPGKREMRFRPTVQDVEPQHAFSWLGSVLMPGLFDGRHEFLLEPIGPATRFHHRETFSGLLVPLLWKSMQAPTQAGFESMNRALKLCAESLAKD